MVSCAAKMKNECVLQDIMVDIYDSGKGFGNEFIKRNIDYGAENFGFPRFLIGLYRLVLI